MLEKWILDHPALFTLLLVAVPGALLYPLARRQQQVASSSTEAEVSPSPPTPATATATWQQGCVTCLVLAGFAFVGLWWLASATRQTGPGHADPPSIGEPGVLENGEQITFVATSPEAYRAMVDAAIANDSRGVTDLVLGGRLMPVKSGTKALVLDVGDGLIRVRMQDGEWSGRAGWIKRGHIRK